MSRTPFNTKQTAAPQKKSGKGGIIAAITALLVAGVGAAYIAKPEWFGNAEQQATTTVNPKSAKADKAGKKAKKKKGSAFDGMKLVSTTDWSNVEGKRNDLAEKIKAGMSGDSESAAQDFIKDAANRMLVAQWLIAQAEIEAVAEASKRQEDRQKNLEKLQDQLKKAKEALPEGMTLPKRNAWNLAQLEKKVRRAEAECAADYTMADAVKDKKAATMMEAIAEDEEWLQQFAFTGECVRPGMALAILVKIAEKNADFFTNRMVRDIATATALEYAKSGWNQEDAVERADYYIRNYKAGRLNSVFDTIPFWQRRMVCGCKGDNPYGSIASLEWSLENVHLPAHEYPGSCWRCAYRLNNIYGDSIHGPQYYAPWEGTKYDNNRTALTYLVGGVCGSLSHFGAFSALANGIPAMTAGEPGHCAYIVLVDKKWTPAYSLTWERGLHWQVFRNVYTYSSLHAATEMYADDAATGKTAVSNALRVAGNIHRQKGQLSRAIACFEAAVKAQPRNFMAWREWTEALAELAPDAHDKWEDLNKTLCAELVPTYPELSHEVMQKGLLEGMGKAMAKDKKKLRKCLLDFWRACDQMGPDRWRIEQFADAQLKQLGISAKTPAELCSFYSDLLSCTSDSAAYMNVMLGWGNKLSEGLGEKDRAAFMESMVKGIQKGKGMSAEDRDALLGPALLAAEKNRDMNTFQAIGNMLSDKYKKPSNVLPKHEPFPGKLASQGGLVWMSSTSKWDQPCSHWGLIEPCGGNFHTGKDTDAYVVVQLPRQVHVTGVVLITNPGNLHRLNNMKVQVSEDGENWTDVHQFGPCKQRVMSTDLGGKLPVAKYVRILRPGGPEFFHLNGIYVYGNQAA